MAIQLNSGFCCKCQMFWKNYLQLPNLSQLCAQLTRHVISAEGKKRMFIFVGEQRREGGYKPSFSSNNMKQTIELRSASHKQKPETSFSCDTWLLSITDSLITGFWCDCSMTTRLQQYAILAWRVSLIPSASQCI